MPSLILETEPEFIFEALKEWTEPHKAKDLGTARKKTAKTINDILKAKRPTEIERCSLIGKMLTANWHEYKNLNNQEIFSKISDIIHMQHAWENYKPETTEKKLFDYMQGWIEKKRKELPQAAAEQEAEPEEKPLPFLKVREIMETPKEKSFVVKGLIPKDSLNLLLSPPKTFKSTTALYLAVCVSNEKNFLGFETKKTVVAYLDKENRRQKLMEIINKIFTGLKLRKKNFPLFFLLKQGLLDDADFVQKLKAFIQANKVGLLVFDTLLRFNSGDENSAQDMNKIYQAFTELQKETGTAILFLHHTNREGSFRGSSDLLGQVDSMYCIERKKDSNLFTITNPANRDGEINDIPAEIIFGEKEIIIQRAEAAAVEEKKQDYNKFAIARAIILDFAQKQCKTKTDWFARSQVIKVLEDWNEIQDETKKVSERYLDSALSHLKTIEILGKGVKSGQYCFTKPEHPQINHWISWIGQGNAINPVHLYTKKEALQELQTEEQQEVR